MRRGRGVGGWGLELGGWGFGVRGWGLGRLRFVQNVTFARSR